MANYGFVANGVYLEEKYVQWSEVNLQLPPAGAGTLWSVGKGNDGILGTGSTTNVSTLVQVGANSTWRTVASGTYHCLAIRTDGTLWSWGDAGGIGFPEDGQGVLGLGDVNNRSSPTQVGTLTNWKDVAGSYDMSYALKTDGTVWSWGSNNNTDYPLGLGDTTDRSSPVQVGTGTDWVKIFPRYYGAYLIKGNGELWGFGAGYWGTLGNNNTTAASTPILISSTGRWKSAEGGYLSHALGVKEDGTLWAWGDNTYGQLGQNNITHRSSPVQVGTDTNWAYAKPVASSSFAIKTDGTLWSWGWNGYGQLGIGSTADKSTPVQVGALTDWSTLNKGHAYGSISAIKKDGTLWVWGSGVTGGNYTGDNLPRVSSPVQLSTRSWKVLAHAGGGFDSIIGIRYF